VVYTEACLAGFQPGEDNRDWDYLFDNQKKMIEGNH
jgi:hypothetical protein